MYKEIYLDAPNIGELEKKYLSKVIDSGYVSTIGLYVSEFEEKFARYLSVKKAVSAQSGTASIHIALYELGIGKEDEVIVPALTFVATVNPVIYVEAKPVFVDVDSKTWDINPEEIEKHISEKTKAIIPVHLYGNPCNMDGIMDIANKHNVPVIEDATESLGAKYKGKYTGTFGDLGCFSFNGNKTVTTGGGGMVVGNDERRLAHIKCLANQAKDESREYYHSEIGFNYRMTNIEAALGLAQMERLDKLLSTKKLLNEAYQELLGDTGVVHFQSEYKGAESSRWMTCVYFEDEVDVNTLQTRLKDSGIHTRRVFTPVVEFPPYRKYRHQNFNNSQQIHKRGLCLPSSTLNSVEDIYYVCKKIKEFL